MRKFGSERRPAGAARNYPPLMLAAIVSLLLLAVLPSALSLPQANPGETLEYAPVPPEGDDDLPPPAGNFSSLGLGTSSALGGQADGSSGVAGDGGGGVVGRGAGKNPRTKRCIGDPPRQTSDPMSPPCVAYYEGDNGGATYQGVTGEEVRILFYIDSPSVETTSRGQEERPKNKYIDLWEPPEDDENVHARGLRVYQRHFNERYQLYGRTAHFFVYFINNSSSSVSPEMRRADAADNFKRIKPFAVVAMTKFGATEAYLEVMVRKGVLNFGSAPNRSATFYSRFAGLVWGYLPTLEINSRFYSSYVCDKVVNRPVSFGGNDGDTDTRLHNGSPRRLGLLRTTDESEPELLRFAALVKEQIEACGGEFVAEASFPAAGYAADPRRPPVYAEEGVAAFRQEGVSTVIWAGGYETNYSKAAGRQNYRPEWVIAGDGILEGRFNSQLQDQSVWRHAWTVSGVTLVGDAVEEPCYQAIQDAEPGYPSDDIGYACYVYADVRQLFTGIQVAGPDLNPASLEKGFRAIPAIASDSPRVPACFYEPGDYTCVKDSVAMWWDPEGMVEGESDPGCWRMIYGGRRFLINQWPSGDVLADQQPDDVCNNHRGSFFIR